MEDRLPDATVRTAGQAGDPEDGPANLETNVDNARNETTSVQREHTGDDVLNAVKQLTENVPLVSNGVQNPFYQTFDDGSGYPKGIGDRVNECFGAVEGYDNVRE